MTHIKNSTDRPRVPFLTLDQKQLISKHVFARLSRFGSVLAVLVRPLLPESWRTVDRPIFMIGCSRSGTTLICNTFARHEDLANWSQAGLVFALDYHDGHIDHGKEAADVTRFDAKRLPVLLGLYTRLKGRKRILNKQLMNSVRVNYLTRIFPDALFIHIIRDGRAVVLSNDAKTTRDSFRQRIPYGNFPKPPRWREYLNLPQLERYAYQWVGLVGYVLDQCGGSAPRENYIEVRYEEFCRDPHGCLRRLDAFCRLAPEGRDYSSIDRCFEDRGLRSIEATSNEQLARIAPIIAPLMERLGYPDPNPPGAIQSAKFPGRQGDSTDSTDAVSASVS